MRAIQKLIRKVYNMQKSWEWHQLSFEETEKIKHQYLTELGQKLHATERFDSKNIQDIINLIEDVWFFGDEAMQNSLSNPDQQLYDPSFFVNIVNIESALEPLYQKAQECHLL